MTDSEKREAARKFASKWKAGGSEKQEAQNFWRELLHKVLGIEDVEDYIEFEKEVYVPDKKGSYSKRFIDGYIPERHVLIEQKGSTHPLDVPEHQSGGEWLTPYEQAKRYNDNLPADEKALWIVTCNFTEFWIYNMNSVKPTPSKIFLSDLQDKYPAFEFLVKPDVKKISPEMELSIKAGEIVGKIYDAFLKQYGLTDDAPNEMTPEQKASREFKMKSLNALCVRLVFCLYAEDAPDLFEHNQFHDYLEQFPSNKCRGALINLFKTLDTPVSKRDEYLDEDLKAFPYVNGGLFADESIEIPQLNDEIKHLILVDGSENFDWKGISPTIFGAVFESTLNPETRRSGGMHYTSLENIHKVIDPLFLNDLKAELNQITSISIPKVRRQKLDIFQQKLASLVFLDPACGSGNFLTETYISLRRLENEALRIKEQDQISFGMEATTPIKVSIQQFYGIEINDFASTVAKTALWIAESQMLQETKNILFGWDQDFFPLKTYVNITEGNALQLDWNQVIPAGGLNYIMGNPPFVGYKLQTQEQKKDLSALFSAKNIDYVAGWYYKAADMMNKNRHITTAFVSTNSITQGEQVEAIWESLYQRFKWQIEFAYRTFIWGSEATNQAHVHCVIIGFSLRHDDKLKTLYESEDGTEYQEVKNINAYLVPADNIFVKKSAKPLCNVQPMIYGSEPREGGNLILSESECKELIEETPGIERVIRQFVSSEDFINRKLRYCLWITPNDFDLIKKSKIIMKRLAACRAFREKSKQIQAHQSADRPWQFTSPRQPDSDYLLIPVVSSQNRRYIPVGYMDKNIIASNACFTISHATLYTFGIIESNVHMAWMRAVCGRLKSDYRYSNTIVYNNFPWPTPAEEQKLEIEKTAQLILDACNNHKDCSYATLYDPLLMPPDLRTAIKKNNIAVMHAYGFKNMSESDCVARLMQMYKTLAANA